MFMKICDRTISFVQNNASKKCTNVTQKRENTHFKLRQIDE